MVSGARGPITPLQMTDEQVGTQRRVRRWLVFDPLLLLAALGLVACSVVTLRGPSRAEDYSYTTHQLIYAGTLPDRLAEDAARLWAPLRARERMELA